MAPSIVLVHGGFVDGSGWEGVYNILKRDGYSVGVVQNATKSHADDVATTKQVIAAQKDAVILVGHSYGGAVITEAGTDPKVAGLVYLSVCGGQGRVGVYSHQGSTAWRAGAADPATAARLSLP